ncbi:MarR family winged helix-turn-helix transcriptional regulator [Marinomonas spartinae]|uniref:MarR family winged helix-turn-helix transcriptional regulator n=1 Tax=Marinomonas spartinae TaxID=1792290 RepID=UPI0018F1A46E|nr:MarR family transcriptional regulator [Marinomonas spartinae]MBJ7554384.1 MarR family transcriptional regulator [Marinomonas spartinae]
MAQTDTINDTDIDFGMLEESVGYRLRRAQMNFFAKFSELCSDLGISPGLFSVLVIVEKNPGLTQTAVAQALGNDRSAMVAAVDKLENMKLIERRPAKNDRRSYALFMTKYGQEFFEMSSRKVRDYENTMMARLHSDHEKDQLVDMLKRLS